MKNIKILWTIIILLIAFSAFLLKAFVTGKVDTTEDNRISVLLDTNERDYMLSEMRRFLVNVQAVSKAITAKDEQLVIDLAQKASQMEALPGSLLQKVPLAMKTLGFDTHTKFGEIAKTVESSKDLLLARQQLDTLMDNCVGCHKTYRLPEPKGRN